MRAPEHQSAEHNSPWEDFLLVAVFVLSLSAFTLVYWKPISTLLWGEQGACVDLKALYEGGVSKPSNCYVTQKQDTLF